MEAISKSNVTAGGTFSAVLGQLGSLHLFLKMLITTNGNKMKIRQELPVAVSYSQIHPFVRLYYHPYKQEDQNIFSLHLQKAFFF